jgi:dUTP pyrophosphatase
MSTVEIRLRRLPHGEGLPLPQYQTALAAGLDLVAAVAEDAPVTLEPGKRALIPCGIAIALPPGFEAQIRPRSGLALNHGVTVLNSPGTIDADYRGELHIILVNLGQQSFTIKRGIRIAQLVVSATVQASICVVASLDDTTRGARGFGSTGTTSQN